MKDDNCYAADKFARMASDADEYQTVIFGRLIPVFPGVFSPEYFSDVAWFAKHIPRIVGKRSFLEIGTGTGVIALFVALNGARKLVATDINPAAIRNARKTFRSHRISASVRLGDVFAPIAEREKFDVIFWNHPFHYSDSEPKTMLERGGYDYHYDAVRAFFKGAMRHLAKGGEVLLGTSQNARLDLIKGFAGEYGYRTELLHKDKIQSRSRKGVQIDVRVYSFRPQNEND